MCVFVKKYCRISLLKFVWTFCIVIELNVYKSSTHNVGLLVMNSICFEKFAVQDNRSSEFTMVIIC